MDGCAFTVTLRACCEKKKKKKANKEEQKMQAGGDLQVFVGSELRKTNKIRIGYRNKRNKQDKQPIQQGHH